MNLVSLRSLGMALSLFGVLGACSSDGAPTDTGPVSQPFSPPPEVSGGGIFLVEDCSDGADNDHDGDVDCYDSDCVDTDYCVEDCSDGVDNDVDGDVDCYDMDCVGTRYCREDCSDGVDNDVDGDVDCYDMDCVGRLSCQERCCDGADNDVDGDVDCYDSDCVDAACCQEDCSDGADNDLDGDVDCDDSDCVYTRYCRENCLDGVDNDLDGLVDCEDGDCAAVCSESCGDGTDNDGDGLVDCDDDDCWDVCLSVSMKISGGGPVSIENHHHSGYRRGAGGSTFFHTLSSVRYSEFSWAQGTLWVKNPPDTTWRSCTWRADDIEFGMVYRKSWKVWFSIYPFTSATHVSSLTDSVWLTRATVSTSGGCGVPTHWFLPAELDRTTMSTTHASWADGPGHLVPGLYRAAVTRDSSTHWSGRTSNYTYTTWSGETRVWSAWRSWQSSTLTGTLEAGNTESFTALHTP